MSLASEEIEFSSARPIMGSGLGGIGMAPLFTLEKSEEMQFSIDQAECELLRVENWDIVRVSDLQGATAPGEPQLPMKTMVLKLPLDAKVSSVQIISGHYVEILNELDIAPTPKPVRWGEDRIHELSPNKQVYSLDSYFPGDALRYDVGKDNQNQYVYVRVYPVQYIPGQKKAILITDAVIRVYYSDSGGFFQPLAESTGSYWTSSPGDVKAVIITPPELHQQAVQLAAFHNSSLLANTSVVNTTWIYSNYAEAEDPPYSGYKTSSLDGWSNIKNYNYSLAKRIINYTRGLGVEYVVLFGSDRYVPPSYMMHISHYNTYNNWIPTDFFYASPDYDITANYMIGRLPANNTAEAQHIVDKIVSWHGNSSIDWFKEVSIVGGKPFGSSFFYGELITIDSVNQDFFEGMNVTKLFRTYNRFTKPQVMNALSGNTGFLYVITHGSGDCWQVEQGPDNSICASDLLNMSENPNTSVVVSIACMNGAFDTNLYPDPHHHSSSQVSFGEGVLLSNASGIAYVGGARVNYGAPGTNIINGYLEVGAEPYMAGMLTYVFEGYHAGADTLGNITKYAMNKFYTEKGMASSINNVTFFEFVLLGDPVLPLPTAQATTYNKPNLTAVSPDGYTFAGSFMWSSGYLPYYNLDTGEDVDMILESDSPGMDATLLNLNSYFDVFVERVNLTPANGTATYSFIPPENALYMIRGITDDFKEGWLYTYTQTVPPNATLYLSGPASVKEGYWVQIQGQVTPSLLMNFTGTLTHPGGSQQDLGTESSNRYGMIYFDFDTSGFVPGGEYMVTVQGQLESLSLLARLQFKIKDYDNLEIMLLSSKSFNTTSCEAYNFTGCNVWPINTSGIIDSSNCAPDNCDIVNFSNSGIVHNATIDLPGSGKRYIAVIDTSTAWNGSDYIPVYDMVFIDDDPVFMQSAFSEVDVPEKGFLTEDRVAGRIQTTDGEDVDIRLSKISRNGDSILLTTPPASDESVYDTGDLVNFIVMASSNGNPKSGIDVSPEYRYDGIYQYSYALMQSSTTDYFGLSSSYAFPVYKAGSYSIIADNSRAIIRVRAPFEVRYRIKDADTGKEKSFFTPGDTMLFEAWAVDRASGVIIHPSSAFILVTLPPIQFQGGTLSASTYVYLTDSDSDGIYEGTLKLEVGDLPSSYDEVPSGTWSVEVHFTSEEGIRDIVRTSFEVKTFEVMIYNYDRYSPNESAYILVGAVKPGSWGGSSYYKIPEFYPIDDPDTQIDECSRDDSGNFRNLVIDFVRDRDGIDLNITDWKITNVQRFLEGEPPEYRSQQFEEFKRHADGMPENYYRQCVIQFRTPVKKSIYTGDVQVKRADTDEWESGSFLFSVRMFDAYAHAWDPDEGYKWAFSPGSNVSLRIKVYDLYNHKSLPASDIIDAKINEIRGMEGAVEILNQSFYKTSEYALLKFTAPNQTGGYEVKFMVTVLLNESGTLRNETEQGRGWFSVRLYDIWGYTKKWTYSTGETVPVEVNVRDFNGNPVSNIKIEVEQIKNWETHEDYTNKTVWYGNATDANGQTKIMLVPNVTWTRGWYDVRLKGTDPDDRYEYGWASFRIKNYVANVLVLVDGMYQYTIAMDENVTFVTLVEKTSSGSSLDYTDYSIVLNESVLNYFGNQWSYQYEAEKVRFTDLNATVWQTTYYGQDVWAINVSLDSSMLEPGSYEASIKFDIGGEEEVGERWFRMITFEPHADVLEKFYGPGDNISINVSVAPAQAFNVTLKYIYGCFEYECSDLDLNATTLQCGSSCLYNITLPPDVEEGSYYATLQFDAGGESEYESIWFEVKNLNIVSPKSVYKRLWSTLTNRTYVYGYYGYLASASPCSGMGYNATIPPEVENNSCTLFNSTLTRASEYAGIQPSEYFILIDRSLNEIYVDTNLNFTDGNLTYNSTVNDSFTDSGGLNWTIRYVGYDWLELEADNGLSNGILVNLSLSRSGKFMFGYFNETEFSGYWWEEEGNNLNESDGELDDIYLLAVDTGQAGVYDEVFIEYDVSDLAGKQSYPSGSQVDLGTPVYIIELSKTIYDDLAVFLAIPEASSYYRGVGTRRVNTNVTIPVMVTYPNGTPIQNANVSIYKVIKSNLKVIEYYPGGTWYTDSNGMANFTYNMTQSGYYTIIPKAQVDSKQSTMRRWDAPHVEAMSFHAHARARSKINVSGFEMQTPVRIEEATSFPRKGRHVYMSWNHGSVTPPNNVTDYYAGYTYMYDDPWWFLVDNVTGGVYIDDDAVMNDSDWGLQSVSMGEDFWLYWTEWAGKTYNITFQLMKRPAPGEIVFGFELGNRWTFDLRNYKKMSIAGNLHELELVNISSDETNATLIVDGVPFGINLTNGRRVVKGDIEIYMINLTKFFFPVVSHFNASSTTGYSLRIANLTLDSVDYQAVILDSPDYETAWGAYDTILIGQSGNLSAAASLHPGDSITQDWYLSKIDNWGYSLTVQNGSTKVINPPQAQSGSSYLIKKIYEQSLGLNGTDLNDDGYINDEFYFIIYDYPWDDEDGHTRLAVDDDYDFFSSWQCNGVCYPIDWAESSCGWMEMIVYGHRIQVRVGESVIFSLAGVEYQITVVGINSDATDATIDINGEAFDVDPIDDNLVHKGDLEVFIDAIYVGRSCESGEQEDDYNSLPSEYLGIIHKYFFYDNQSGDLALLESQHIFEPTENITFFVEAEDFDWSPIEGNVSVIELEVWGEEYNASREIYTDLVGGYAMMTLSPPDFKLNATENLTEWLYDFRIVGKVNSNDQREEIVTVWVRSETPPPPSSGGGGGSGGGIPPPPL